MVKLEMPEPPADLRCKKSLFLLVALRDLADEIGLPAVAGNEVKRSDKAVETAGKKGNAIFRRQDRRTRKHWPDATIHECKTPDISCKEAQLLLNEWRLRLPEPGIGNGDAEIDLACPAVGALIPAHADVGGRHRKGDRQQIPGATRGP